MPPSERHAQARLLENRADPEAATRLLTEAGPRTSDVVVAARSGDENRAATVHNALWRNSFAYLITLGEGLLYAPMPADSRWEPVLTRSLGSSARIGVSQNLKSLTRFQDALREATWALSLASRRDTLLSHYVRESHWIGLSDVDDARALVDRVRRIAELTGLDPADTEALVELWTALRAAELLDAR